MGSEIEMKAVLTDSLHDTLKRISMFEDYKLNEEFVCLYKQDVYYSADGKKPADISDAVRLRKEGDFGTKRHFEPAVDAFLMQTISGKDQLDKGLLNTTYSLTMKEKFLDGFIERNKEYETTFKNPEVIHRLLDKAGFKQYLNKIKHSLSCYLIVEDKYYLHLEFVSVGIDNKFTPIYLETEATFDDDVSEEQYEKIKSLLNELYERLGITDFDYRTWPNIIADIKC